ncbi:MAG: hypothetical protein RL112_1606, partial [Planctomycetota bacterium]
EGGLADIEALCAAHPELAGELRRLHERQARWGGLVAEPEADRELDPDFAGALVGDAGRGDGPSLFHRSGAGAAAQPARGLSFAGGEVVGGFRLVKFLGRGGMGEVWEAEQQGLRRRVALKFLLDARFDERVLQYFLREARAGGRVRHPNVVATIASGSDGGIDWIAQELVRGSRSLRDAIEDLRRLPQLPSAYHAGVARLVEGVARGMQAAHEAGVVHRDLKPQNILVDERDQPRIVDFGLARVADESMLSKSGEVVGTWHYMSPEQVAGSRGGLDHRSDIFSLGVVLYELATLERPFTGDSETAVARRIAQDEPADPRSLRSQCPRDLAVVCLKALEKRPEARYQSMEQFAEDLRRVQAHEPIRARPAGPLERARKWFRRNPALGVGLAAGALFLASVSTLAVVAFVQARRAELAAEEARRKTADVLALSAQKEHDELVAEARALWPIDDALAPRCEAWLARARRLVEGGGGDAAADAAPRPSLAEHRAKLESLRAAAALAPLGVADAWWEQQLGRLVADLELLVDESRGGLATRGISPTTGWGVARRLEVARGRRARTTDGPEAARRWNEALASIAASERYRDARWPGGRLSPQVGLSPLEQDPRSGLWEFLVDSSGDEPARGADGRLARDERGQMRLTEATGLVLVLLPGGEAWHGAQATDPAGRNYDPQAEPVEGPPKRYLLSPYFVGKHEVTQAQWLRLTGANAAYYTKERVPEYIAGTGHPLEQASQRDATTALAWLGLELPTHVQWAHAARGGTSTPWWTGAERESLRGNINIADAAVLRAGAGWTTAKDWPDLDDGFVLAAPPGSFPANPFGLHEVLGNVSEWCRDGRLAEDLEGTLDPVGAMGEYSRQYRGGCYSDRASTLRASYWVEESDGYRDSSVGVRVSRAVQP